MAEGRWCDLSLEIYLYNETRGRRLDNWFNIGGVQEVIASLDTTGPVHAAGIM
jgi:hypothetical protein